MSDSRSRKRRRKNLNKEAKDLLSKDHVKGCSTTTVVTFSSAVENGRLSNSNIAAKYAYKNATVDVNVDSKSNLSATIGFHVQILPSTKTIATLKLPDYSSSKLEFQYLYKHNAIVTSLVLSQSPSVSLSATIGNPTMAFRMKAVCKTGHGFTNYDARIHSANPNCNASIILANKCDLLKASYVHRFHQPVKIATGAEITRRFSTKENTFTVTGSCRVDQMTTLTARVGNLRTQARTGPKPSKSPHNFKGLKPSPNNNCMHAGRALPKPAINRALPKPTL